MGTADQLLEQIFSWIKQRECCAEKLKKLAGELESLRKKCNGSKAVGNSVSVAGAACLIGAGVATVLTAGAAGPFLAGLGGLYTGVGLTISVATEITEQFMSSDTMKDAKKIAQKSNETGKKIEQLFEKLKAEKRAVNSFIDPDELDRDVMIEILGAMARRTLKFKTNVHKLLYNLRFIFDSGLTMLNQGSLTVIQMISVILVSLPCILAFFALKAEGKTFEPLFAKGAEQLIKKVPSTGFKTFLKGGGLVVGGAVGMVFALPEAIDNWKDLIKNNNVTEASKSLRDTADAILKINQTLREELDKIKRMLEEMAKRQQEQEEKLSREITIQQERKAMAESRRKQKNKRIKTGTILTAFTALVLWLLLRGDQNQRSDRSINEESNLKFETNQRPPGAITLGLLNLWSVNDKRSTISELIRQNNLDVFLATETWLNRRGGYRFLSDPSPPDFSFYHQLREGRGGGVAILLSQALRVEQIPFDFITTFEFVATALQHDEWAQPVLLINVYRPLSYTLTQFCSFLDEFQMLLDEVENYGSIIVTGDFNIWVDNVTRTTIDDFYCFLKDNGLVQHVKEPTRQAGHFLDLVITRNVEISDLFVRDDGIIKMPLLSWMHPGDQGDEESDCEEEESDQEDEESSSEEETEEDENKQSHVDQKQKSDRSFSQERNLKFETNQIPSGAIRMGLANVCSLNKTKDNRRIPEVIKELITRNKLDIFLTTETCLKIKSGDKVLEEASPQYFRFFHKVRPIRQTFNVKKKRKCGGGGVAIQFSQALEGKKKRTKKTPETFEYVAVELQYDEWGHPVLSINVYRPPGFTQFDAFLKEFKRLLDELSEDYNSIIITGDFNIHVDDETKTSTIKFKKFLQENNLVQHVDKPTHQAGHTLDLVITRNVEISVLTVQNDGISDHSTVYFNARPVSKETHPKDLKNPKEKINENIDEEESAK